ncbi:uncharacterized protein V1518DRAFT_8377 [Limtongia smithiae]|uniref:uncharacterized protein n=1 Tax=Limtongia smithiae TaxID=1125753 RepID=UPI0034CE23B5
MSNQSGITASPALYGAVKSFVDDATVRTLLIKIEKESLELDGKFPWQKDYFEDIEQIASAVASDRPLYIVHKGDGSSGYTLISYIPDAAPVREKMLYASTRNTLMRELGSDKIASSYFATERDELTAAGLRKFVAHEKLSKPLTEEERALKSVQDIEAKEGFAGTATRKTYVSSGLSFPVTAAAEAALAGLAKKQHNVVVLAIDTGAEEIGLDRAVSVAEPGELGDVVSTAAPRYTFYLYTHVHDGAETESLVFLYTCPAGSTIRERMMYASCRGGAIAGAEAATGLPVAKRLEGSDGTEASAATLEAALHPHAEAAPRAFARPRAPGRRR